MRHTFLKSTLATAVMLLAIPLVAQDEGRHRVKSVLSENDGPSVVVYLPTSGGRTTLGTFELLSNVSLLKGTMTLVHGAPDEQHAEVPGSPQWVVLIEQSWDTGSSGDDESILPSIRSNVPGRAANLAAGVLLDSFGGTAPRLTITELPATRRVFGADTIIMTTPTRDVPKSRRNRWERNLVLDLLVELEMLDERPAPSSLIDPSPLSFGLYDAEGVGGIGPRQMERIVADMPGHVPVMRLCPEDIHDGALDAFAGAIFPGGSGRGIAVGLEEKGRELLMSYIEEGGGYMGICAGAYFVTDAVDVYLGAVPLAHNQPWRKGGGMLDVELTGEGRAILGEEFTTFSTRYNNGPVYLDDVNSFDDVTVLAHFRSAVNKPTGELSTEMIDTPAIIASKRGEGRILMISPHPETHSQLFPMLQRGLLWMTKRGSAE